MSVSNSAPLKLYDYNSQKGARLYKVFHRFGQAKFADVGSILGSSQFLLLSPLPKNMKLPSKVFKVDSK
jgi:hypothetical protein